MRRLTKWAGAAVIAAGLATMAQGAFVPAKAWVGQLLLEQAWADGTKVDGPAPPWSWADFKPLAQISVPRLDMSAVVLDQASGNAMAWGPGHVAGTASLGAPGLAAIAGHRDTHLAFAADLRPGDRIDVATHQAQLTYEVTDAIVVDSRTWRFPAQHDGQSVLALATCWPFGAQTPGPLRFVVFAKLINQSDA